ncbi:MAG: hypothetical protein VW397_08340, partial [Candidatus Margulisiibacteriota bacterium]
IDPANMFEFGWEQRLLGPELKNVAYNGGESMFNQTENVFLFELFSNKTQVEFLQTFREILDVEMATFSDIFESILPQPGIITNQLKHQLMGLIENRKKEINRLYFSQKPPSFDLITLEERSFSLDSLSHSLTQLESIVTFRKTKYNSEISRLPKFSQLWLLAETILYPKFQLAPNMPKNYPLYWLEVFNCMSEPYQLPNSPNAPITAYMCLSGEVILSFDNEDSHTKKVVFPGEVAMVNYKHQKVTVHPSKGVCMLIEMYNQ